MILYLLAVFITILFINFVFKKKKKKLFKLDDFIVLPNSGEYYYLTILKYKKNFYIFGRNNYENKEKMIFFKKRINSNKLINKDYTINNIKNKNIETSLKHNFAVSFIDGKWIGNGGRDPDISINYKKGHDKGMYFFVAKDKNLNFKEKLLGITIKTGAKQKHKCSNENFTNILKVNNKKYLIYSRYNIDFGKRKTQVFISNNGINNWKLFGVLELYKNNKLLENYSIYAINVCYVFNKYIGTIRFSNNNFGEETKNPNYNLYIIISNDGIKFDIIKKIFDYKYWPCNGYYVENNKLNMFVSDTKLIKRITIEKDIIDNLKI